MQHPAQRLALPLRPCGRRAFTLVEMLVVICIMAIIAAIAFGSLFGMVGHNRLLATEQLIADSVRQARHTARSTGQPAVLTITPVLDDAGTTVVGGRIAGTSRICVWSETFDGVDFPALGTLGWEGLTVGRSGKGMIPSGFPLLATKMTRTSYPQAGQDSLPKLKRGSRSDGFYLSCSVLLPLAPIQPSGSSLPDYPLLLIGRTDEVDQAQAGLAVRCLNPLIATAPSGDPALESRWELLGWIGDQNATGSTVGSLADSPAALNHNAQGDATAAVVGGRWTEFGMLWESGVLTLFVDGRQVAERTDLPIALPSLDDPHIFVGRYTVNPNPATYATFPIDDCQLFRLGTDQPANLPGGVVAVNSANDQQGSSVIQRIVAMPDGRVQLRSGTGASQSASGGTMLFRELKSVGQTTAEITISSDGHVTNRLSITTAAP